MRFRQYRWIQASRPLSQINIAIPLLAGESLAYFRHQAFSWENVIWIHGFGILSQLFIVYTNDRLDIDADTQNHSPTLISGGSRVLQQGKLQAHHLFVASSIVAGLMLVLAFYRLFSFDNDYWFLAATLSTFLLTWAYSAHPLRMSYRGYGEWLQMLGIGLVLPATGFAGQYGQLEGFVHPLLLLTLMIGYCGNLLTALPDYASDRSVAKRSPAVVLGPERTQDRLLFFSTLSFIFVVSYSYFTHESNFNSILILCWLFAAISLAIAFLLRYRDQQPTPAHHLKFSLCISNVFNALLMGSSIWLFQ